MLLVQVSAAWRVWKQLSSHVGAKCYGRDLNKCSDPRSACFTNPWCPTEHRREPGDPDMRSLPQRRLSQLWGHLRPVPLTPHIGPPAHISGEARGHLTGSTAWWGGPELSLGLQIWLLPQHRQASAPTSQASVPTSTYTKWNQTCLPCRAQGGGPYLEQGSLLQPRGREAMMLGSPG